MADDRTSLESRTIEWLRFAMAAAVVLLHTGALGVGSTQPVYHTLSVLTSAGLCRIAVPCFFFISGFFFFKKLDTWDNRLYLSKLKSRVRTLLIPYILWNLIAALVLWGYPQIRTILQGGIPVSFWDNVKDWGGLWDKGVSFDGPLWFVRDLMLFCICAPVIHFFVTKCKGVGMIILCLLSIIARRPEVQGILFFAGGAYLQLNNKQILNAFRPFKTASYLLSVVLLAGIVVFYDNQPTLYGVLREMFVITGTVAVFSIVSSGLEKGFLHVHPLLAASSFFVFASHNILILHDISHALVLHLIPFRNEFYNCIDLFLRPTFAVTICVCIYWIMSKLTPRTLGLLAGGRVAKKAL